MAQAYSEVLELNIRDLTICEAFINFQQVSEAIERISTVVRSIEESGTVHDVTGFRGIGNWFEVIEIGLNVDNMIVKWYDEFWACVCLGLEKILCKRSSCLPHPNIVKDDPKITVNDPDIIESSDLKTYKERIERVCRQHKPPLRVQWKS